LAHAIVKPNQRTLPHKLTTVEIYHILIGKWIMYIDDEQEKVEAGDTIYIPPTFITVYRKYLSLRFSFLVHCFTRMGQRKRNNLLKAK